MGIINPLKLKGLLSLILMLLALGCSMRTKVYHKKYSQILYSHKFHNAIFVNYQLKKGESNKGIKRTDDFRIDFLVDSTISLEDYKYSGYDRGHLKPAGSSKTSKEEMSESFLLSNISPQYPQINRGTWKSIEEYERKLLNYYDSLNINTGTIFKNYFNKKLPNSKIRVPKYFFKTIMTPDSLTIAFLCANEAVKDSVQFKYKSVNEIEKMIHQDLYPGLPEKQENTRSNNLTLKY